MDDDDDVLVSTNERERMDGKEVVEKRKDSNCSARRYSDRKLLGVKVSVRFFTIICSQTYLPVPSFVVGVLELSIGSEMADCALSCRQT